MVVLLVLVVVAAIGAALYAQVYFRRYVSERQEHRRVVALFSRYVPPPVVEELLARHDQRLFQAREYYATILNCRIRNFALFSEPLSPEETLRYLNEFYTIVGKAVQRHSGMIESLHGETVIAIFGVLLDETFQEERALRASLDIMRLMKAMELRWAQQGRRACTIGIGVNSGKIVAGDTGFEQRREFAIIGNPAEIAARLERASEELNATIVASHTTYDIVRELFVAVPTSSLPLQGLRRLHSAYVIRGLTRKAAKESRLTLPTSAFRKTAVTAEYPEIEEVAEPEVYREPVPAPAEKPVRVDAASVPATIVDTRLATPVAVERPSRRGIEPARAAHFSRLDSEESVLPELSPVETYEDDQGPPVQLPP